MSCGVCHSPGSAWGRVYLWLLIHLTEVTTTPAPHQSPAVLKEQPHNQSTLDRCEVLSMLLLSRQFFVIVYRWLLVCFCLPEPLSCHLFLSATNCLSGTQPWSPVHSAQAYCEPATLWTTPHLWDPTLACQLPRSSLFTRCQTV